MMNRAGVAAATFSALGGGITGVGDDAAAAAMLSQGYNFMPGTSSFNRMMREVGGVGRYFGMQNATAAQAIGGLHTGRMGAQLYQYGINTTDPNTGQPLSTEAVAQQLYSRMTMGGRVKASAESMAINLREGFGSRDMQMFDSAQRAILEPMLISMAAGKPIGDLGKLPFNPDNPQNAPMKLATSMTSLMERGTEPMIAGFESAANAAAALNAQLEKLPDGFFKTKGFVQGLSNTNVGSAISGVVGAVAGAAGTLLVARGVRNMLGGAAAKAGAAALAGGGATSVISPAVASAIAGGGATTAATTAAKVGLTGLGKAVPIIGGAVSGFGSGGMGSFLASVGTSAAVGAAFGGPIGSLTAGGLTALGFLGAKAVKSMFGTPANAAQTSQTGTQMTAGMDPGLVQTLQNAGFSGDSLNTAYGIVMAESGGRANARGDKHLVNKKWGESVGLFQIRSLQNPQNFDGKGSSDMWRDASKLEDPNFNAQAAFVKSKGGTDWGGWTTFTTGKYLQFKPNANSTSSITSGNKIVNINVNLANASTAEANRLAKQVKEILLKDKDLQEVGGK
jgi:hypothetical protein